MDTSIRPGSGCGVCRHFFQDFEGSITLAELRSDDRQPACLRCAFLEESILQYSPRRPAGDADTKAGSSTTGDADGLTDDGTADEWEDDDGEDADRSVSAWGFGLPQLYLTFTNGDSVSRRYQLYSTQGMLKSLAALLSSHMGWCRKRLDAVRYDTFCVSSQR